MHKSSNKRHSISSYFDGDQPRLVLVVKVLELVATSNLVSHRLASSVNLEQHCLKLVGVVDRLERAFPNLLGYHLIKVVGLMDKVMQAQLEDSKRFEEFLTEYQPHFLFVISQSF